MNFFGTDGVRARIGRFPFTSEALPGLGRALGIWAYEKYGKRANFLIAADTRYSASWVKAHLASGMLNSPLTVYDADILPTPALFHLLKDNPSYTCGLMISASHNPAEDNGIKLIDAYTGKLTTEDEQRIVELMAIAHAGNTMNLGKIIYRPSAVEQYAQKIVSLFTPSFLKGQKIVLDCAHGATYRLAPLIFKALGAETIVLHNKPDGYNINKNCGSLYLEALQKEVVLQKAALGFAFDGDGDRVLAVNSTGDPKDGDDILALLSQHADYKSLPAIVGTIMSNQGFEAHLKKENKQLIRTPVGDKHVIDALTHHRILLGGEPSGHTILHNIISTGDGILVALKIVEALLATGNLEMQSFEKFPQILINVPIRKQKNLNEPPLSDIIAASREKLPTGRLLVRYSGTESLIRVMAEDADSELIKNVAHSLAQQLETVLS